MTTHRMTSDQAAAVATDYYWQPMQTCPQGCKVQLLTIGGVAIYGLYRAGDTFYKGWAPCPKEPDWMKK